MQLLKKLCSVQATSGNESSMTDFILDYVKANSKNWNVQPKVYSGENFQDCIVLVFGEARTAVYAHIDNIGFTVRYNKELVKIGGPKTASDYILVGKDSKGKIECVLKVDEKDEHAQQLSYHFEREIDRGTSLSFKPNFREDENFVQCCYLDNRLGVWTALRLCETLKDGAIVFSCYEEHGGGTAGYLTKFLFEEYKIRQALICDITWITEGVHHGKGTVVSLRDKGIPRKKFTDHILEILNKNKLEHQLEVEAAGGSDGTEIQHSPYPVDWCFIGPPEDFVHSPDEKVHKKDIESTLNTYKLLMEKL